MILLTGLLALAPSGAPSPAPTTKAPTTVVENCVKTGQPTDPEPTAVPWSQQRIQPERVWPLTTGAPVVVAVIDSGIWVDHEQLQGQVIRGRDFLGAPGSSIADCTGHGTAVAGIIGAKPLRGFPVHGVAPGARLLSIRQNERKGDQSRGTADTLALAIREAVAREAKVINISATVDKDDPQLRDAVDYALAQDVVIVAAAGNDDSGARPELAAQAVYWPARYAGVLAVAAIDSDDNRAAESHAGSYVDVAAPGKDVMSTGANGPRPYAVVTGTSFAAPFVSGTAALIRAYHPKLTGRQVVARITATADVPPQGRGGAALGAGIVNPYAAVTAVIPAEGSAATTPPSPVPGAVPALPVSPDRSVRNQVLVSSAVVAALAMLLVLAAVVVPRGRARRWQASRSVPSGLAADSAGRSQPT